jgi:hypothetical protein
MLDAITKFLTGRFGERAVMRWGLLSAMVLAAVGVYAFFIKETSNTFDKYYELKLRECTDASLTVAQIANTESDTTLKSALDRFDELYYGELVLFEEPGLEGEMVKFRLLLLGAKDQNELKKTGQTLDSTIEYSKMRLQRDSNRDVFRRAALSVSAACRYEVTPTLLGAIVDWLNPFHRTYR